MGLLNWGAFVIDVLHTVGVDVHTSCWVLDGMLDESSISQLH